MRSPVISELSPITGAIYDDTFDNVFAVLAAIIYLLDSHIIPRHPQLHLQLPEDLWIEIFFRLPVSSLLRVMCVCKNWYLLIKDPIFRSRHLQFQKMVSKKSGHLLLLHFHYMPTLYNMFLFDDESITSTLTSSLSSLSPSRNLLQLYPERFYSHMDIDGPVNGLYCLHNDGGHTVIWNPAINEAGFLPLPEQCIPADDDPEKYLDSSVVGFGTDPLDEGNYKVVLFSRVLTNFGDDEFVCVMIYTTKTNTWRLLVGDFMVISSLNNTYLNGSYYWMEESKCTAIVFDMSEKEKFRKISTPCHGDFALHNDRITLISLNSNLNEVDIWVMLEDEGGWFKKNCVKGIPECVVKPLGFLKAENEMLLVIGDSKFNRECQTVLYNATTQEIRNIGCKGNNDGFKASVYYESFVTLSGGITKFEGHGSVSSVGMIWDHLLVASPTF